MELRVMDNRKILFVLIILSTGSSDNDLDWNFCGTWRHGGDSLSLGINISTGCKGINISASESFLSINGQISAKCQRSEVISLQKLGFDSGEDINFCLDWEPLLDLLKLSVNQTKSKVESKNLILCSPVSLQDSCCTDLSDDLKTLKANYGIVNTTIKGDPVSSEILIAYNFIGNSVSYRDLCKQASKNSTQNMCKPPYAHRADVEMMDDSQSYDVTSPASKAGAVESSTTVHLPVALKKATKSSRKAVCTFFKNNSLFQEVHKDAKPISDVVAITVENEIIRNLSEDIRIEFYHEVVSKSLQRKCVSWDTRRDSLEVNWLEGGCKTQKKGEKHTVCLCNHLTYFTVLVDLKARPVRHLLALTTISYLGCAVSVISCLAVIIYLSRKKRRSKEQSMPIHLGLAISLAFLTLIFFFTGVLANVGEGRACPWVGAVLHYALLCSFFWMGIEVFHTFWLVHIVFTPSPKPYVWNLVGFVLPAVPVIILAALGDIYGMREVDQSDEPSEPYKMCWMTTSPKAVLAHWLTTMTVLALLVSSGIVLLFLVFRQIRTRDEWKQNHVAFLSIWGLSCLFGTSWGLTFFNFEPLSTFILFLSCILNSFQGFFLMLRFCMLDWMRKQAGGSRLGSTSTGSTRQHMLQAQEKS